MSGVDRLSVDVLVLEVHRRAGRAKTLAIVDADDAAIVSIESVGSSQRQRSTLISKVCSTVESTRCGEPGIQPAAQPKICIGLENDVDDARHAIGIILGRWIGNYLYPLHDVGGDLLEVSGELGSLHRRRTAIELDDHVLIAAETHLAVSIDLDRRRRLKNIAGAARRRRDVLRPV